MTVEKKIYYKKWLISGSVKKSITGANTFLSKALEEEEEVIQFNLKSYFLLLLEM